LALPEDLLAQARHLATKESKKPKQASLRRAVSTAYYALYHLLVAAGASALAPRNPTGLRGRVQRAFSHGALKDVCLQFAQPRSLSKLILALVSQPLEPELVTVGDAFVELQEARHSADYDALIPFDRNDVLQKISIAEQAFTSWKAVRNKLNATVFLAALLLNRLWRQ
jgi:uncharacterized protein (UPF0332 family)